MKVPVTIQRQNLVALIDSESTHNFINDRIVGRLRLTVIPTQPFIMKVANDKPLNCRGRFEDVPITIQAIVFTLTLYSLPLMGLDLVLGVQWREGLGTVACDWKKSTMEFQWQNQPRLLHGLGSPPPLQIASVVEISQVIPSQHSVYAIYFTKDHEVSPPNDRKEFQEIWKEFSELFREPEWLPPQRDIEHQIPLKDGTEPINVRPYRYAYF